MADTESDCYAPVTRFLHPIQVLSQKGIVGGSGIQVPVCENGGMVKNAGSATTGSLFQGLSERLHDEFVGLAMFMQKAERQLTGESPDKNSIHL